MSRFIDRLEKVGLYAPTPMGFGAAARRDDVVASIMLVGVLETEELARNPDLGGAAVDAVLVRVESLEGDALDSVADQLGNHLWGVQLSQVEEDQLNRLKDEGCDFIVFDVGGAPARVLNDEDLGKVLAIDSTMDEDLARAIQDLAIDAVLFLPEGDLLPLTVQKLISVQKVRSLVDKPFLMVAPLELGPADLEALRNGGITGLAVRFSSADEVAGIKKAIAELPRRKPKLTTREAVVPRGPASFGSHAHGGEEEDDDDEEGPDI